MSSTTEPTSTPASTGLPPLRRVITEHDADGNPIINKTLSQHPPSISPGGMNFTLGYSLNESPAILEHDQDLRAYQDRLPHNVGLSIRGGTVLRIVDFLPGTEAPMHRTATVDFGVMMEGEVQLIMGSGETTVLRRGDIVGQRGTLHAWKNNGNREPARGFFVLVDADLPTVNGTKLEENIPNQQYM
ncbi:uncharacterized protein TRIREDRAFT_63381 [Trichoderma reesei QM6a]|jgi:quercetin dioxygenase-like cupin family protein|uniref:Predicted protein n=2 Tax=Hypocrea jecorina TaxID=51453 RepID=G0RLX0_HYPJQ|nr:uncharacterized protein TRIREDRAFT_63381 [Trichoderma reesei QM6a]EGR47817.1 predicted protein [Trichoderma reesei QM6a]ETS01133.1 hypothetical protein M419DRAFT_36116 [Trichoderma reesei RUT C-30]